jgi:DNA polymerase I
MNEVLVGRGKEDHPLIAFVGMNPGREELKAGQPFVGPSGKYLSTICKEVGIDEEQCYFTNAVKESTPKNREPNTQEAKKWRPHLIEELQRVHPKVVVPLGNFAYTETCGRSGISRAAGQPRSLHSRFAPLDSAVVPCNHPAAALRNPSYREPIVQALRFAWRLATGTAATVDTKIVWVDKLTNKEAMEKVVKTIEAEPVLSYDIETNARDFEDPDFTVYLIAISTGEWTFVFGPADRCVRMGAILVGLSKSKTVGHNAIRFDAEGLSRIEPQACKTLRYTTNDTMLLDYLVDENVASHALEPCCHRVLGLEQWKGMVDWSWYDTPAEEIPWQTAVEYVAKDASATLALYQSLLPIVESDPGLLRVYDILRGASPAFVQVERRGVYVRRDVAKQQIEERFQPEMDQALGVLRTLVGRDSFNPNSYKQVAEALQTLGAGGVWWSGGKFSTNEFALKTLANLYPAEHPISQFCAQMLRFRGARVVISTFLKKYMDLAGEDSRIYPGYGLTTTVTGRTSSFKPNYENVPRDKNVRVMIGVPEGKTLLQADYSQAELRLGAMVSQEQNMLAAYREGRDLHTSFAQYILGREEVTKEERTSAKIANFLLLYGAEEQTFIENALKEYDLIVSKQEATRIRDAFHAMWPGLGPWYEQTIKTLKEQGYVQSVIGQKRRLPGIYASDLHTREEAARQGINFLVQSPVAHLGILAATMLVNKLAREFEGVYVCGFVHDAIHLEVPDSLLTDVALRVKEIMEKEVLDYLDTMGAWITVPLVADCEAGPSWGELKKMTLPTLTSA